VNSDRFQNRRNIYYIILARDVIDGIILVVFVKTRPSLVSEIAWAQTGPAIILFQQQQKNPSPKLINAKEESCHAFFFQIPVSFFSFRAEGEFQVSN
jgi:hypothetical protein